MQTPPTNLVNSSRLTKGTLGTDTSDLTNALLQRVTSRAGKIGIISNAADPTKPWQRLARVLLMHLSGQIGAMLLSCVCVVAGLAIAPDTIGLIWWLLALVVIVRIGYIAALGPMLVLGGLLQRKNSWKLLGDEAKISVVILAACQILNWPLSNLTLGFILVTNLILQTLIGHISRLALQALNRSLRLTGGTHTGSRRVLIVGTGEQAKALADQILDTPELDTSLLGFLDYRRADLWRYRDMPLIGHPNKLIEIASTSQLDAVLIAVAPQDIPRTQKLFSQAETMGVSVCFMPDLYRPQLATSRRMEIDGMSALVYRSTPDSRWSLMVKSSVDLVGGFLLLLLSLPIWLTTAIAIKLESRGPILYKQIRSGINGRIFPMLKFRTMRQDADRKQESLRSFNEMSGPVFKIKDDPRITRVGRFLRKFSIDELPQLINVLKGDMSLVGPRPPRPDEVAQYEPWQRRKLSVKPGLTCLWQVNGRNQIDFEDWMKLDLEYIDNWSLKSDAVLLARTIPTILKGTGS